MSVGMNDMIGMGTKCTTVAGNVRCLFNMDPNVVMGMEQVARGGPGYFTAAIVTLLGASFAYLYLREDSNVAQAVAPGLSAARERADRIAADNAVAVPRIEEQRPNAVALEVERAAPIAGANAEPVRNAMKPVKSGKRDLSAKCTQLEGRADAHSLRMNEHDKESAASKKELVELSTTVQSVSTQLLPNGPSSSSVVTQSRFPDSRMNLSKSYSPASPPVMSSSRSSSSSSSASSSSSSAASSCVPASASAPRCPAFPSTPAAPPLMSFSSSNHSSSSASASSSGSSAIRRSVPASGSAPGGPEFPPPHVSPPTLPPDLDDLAKLAKENANKALAAFKPQIKALTPESAKAFKERFQFRKSRGADEETLAEEFGEYKKVLNEYVKGLEASKDAIKAKNPNNPRILEMVIEAGELDDIIEIITQGLKKLREEFPDE